MLVTTREKMAEYLQDFADLAACGLMDGCVLVFRGTDAVTHCFRFNPDGYPVEMVGALNIAAADLSARVAGSDRCIRDDLLAGAAGQVVPLYVKQYEKLEQERAELRRDR